MNSHKYSTYALTNFNFARKESERHEAIVISDNRISALCALEELPEHCPKIDLQGHFLSAGFIDLQLNGCGGVLFNGDICAATLDVMHQTNLRSGCTSFLPTLITCSDEDMVKAVNVIRDYREAHPERTPGLHLEGPYLNKSRKGIHDERLIRTPSEQMIDFICQNSDVVAMVTLAPEICPDGMIQRLSQAGIVVSIGHSNATIEQVRKAEQQGASFVTHLFNAMSQLTPREPGVVGATFSSEILGAGIIADGHHVDWCNLLLSHQLMHDRLVLVTDATPAAGSDLAVFEFAGQTIYHNNGKCIGGDGTLGGSALTMMEAIANSVARGIPHDDAIRMATLNPALVIGQENVMGKIKAGHYANLAVFDLDYALTASISGGHFENYK